MNFSQNMRSIDLIQLCWFIRLQSIWKYTENLFLNFVQSNKCCKENLCNILKFFYGKFYIHSHHWLKNFIMKNFLMQYGWSSLRLWKFFDLFFCDYFTWQFLFLFLGLFSIELNFSKNVHLWIDETSNQRIELYQKSNICLKFKYIRISISPKRYHLLNLKILFVQIKW